MGTPSAGVREDRRVAGRPGFGPDILSQPFQRGLLPRATGVRGVAAGKLKGKLRLRTVHKGSEV